MKNQRAHTDEEYIAYMRAYDTFYHQRKLFIKEGCPKLDSQFSENIAADYFDFTLDHTHGVDGHNAKGESCEVKGTGYGNTRVHFTKNQKKADHIYWVKAEEANKKVIIQEIKLPRGMNQVNTSDFITLESPNSQVVIVTSYTLQY